MSQSWFRRYLLPGFIFQSVVIAGGYGTGREIVEFFLGLGPRGGLAAMAVSTVIWSVVCAVSYEFARVHGAYEYRTFFERLIGPAAWLYEATWYAFMLLVLAVVAAAAGEIFRTTFDVSFWIGVALMSALIGALVFRGTGLIERVLSLWSAVLYAVFLAMFVWALVEFGPRIQEMLAGAAGPPAPDGSRGWLVGGVAYAGYNLAIIPALLFSIRHVASRREAVVAGLVAGPIAMIPAALFFIAMIPHYPGINDAAVPANVVLEALGSRTFQVVFQVMLLGTLIETGTGMIHAVNERVGEYLARRRGRRAGGLEIGALEPGAATLAADPTSAFSSRGRVGLALLWLALAAVAARFGLIGLIARGYGTMTWAFIAIYVVPVLTIGVWKLARADRGAAAPGEETRSPRRASLDG